jgi:hypothetical protein
MPRSVVIVFDPDFSGELEKVAFRSPVWMIDTPPNHSAAENAWREAVEWPHITVTLFRPPEGEITRDDWHALLEQVSLREHNIEAVEVIGASLTPVAQATFTETGLARFEETENGFRVRRI